MASYKTTPRAKEHLRQMWLYGSDNWGEAAANDYIATFVTHFEHLVAYPKAYPVFEDDPEFRRSVHRDKNVFYSISGEDVEISAILGQQDIAKHLRRIK